MSNITQGVKDFLKGSNKADTTEVCSERAPEVVQEHVRPQEQTETAEAIDRERHIHHHQHRVQPVEDHKTLPTQHTHSVAPTVVREHKEEMVPEHQAKLHEMRTQHHDTRTEGHVERSSAAVGQFEQEHVHHHIHETVQPVIQRETVQPTTVHQTIPIHEKIDEAPIVHEATTLPTISHDQFLQQQKSNGDAHTHADQGHHHQHYEGAPHVGGKAQPTI